MARIDMANPRCGDELVIELSYREGATLGEGRVAWWHEGSGETVEFVDGRLPRVTAAKVRVFDVRYGDPSA